ncbi:hypothetical protein ACOMHN_035780 [Nucella lapillus]
MFLNRTKDPLQATQAATEQKKLVVAIAAMDSEDPAELEKIEDLLRSGVDPSVPDYNLSLYYAGKNFYSPIHYAVKKDFIKVTELLLTYKAYANALDRYSVTPAHLASDVGAFKCLKKLIEHGADVNAKTQEFRKRAGEFTNIPVVCEQKLDPEEFAFNILPYEIGTTPLHLAAMKNHVACVMLLIDQGADYNATNARRQTSLYFASKGKAECVMAQLRNAVGFPILSIPTETNDTALHECLRSKDNMTECVKELVHRGADVCHCNGNGETAVHVAIRYEWSMDIIKTLILEGYGMDFDRIKETGFKHLPTRFRDTPLVYVAGDKRKLPMESFLNRNEKLASFFLKMGATRQCLKELLWHELNIDEPAGCLLETIMNCFGYLPSLSELKEQYAEEERSLNQGSSDDEWEVDRSQPIHIRHMTMVQMYTQAINQPNISRLRRSQLASARRNWHVRNVYQAQTGRPVPSDGPSLAVTEKQKMYAERQMEIPSLAHLCRSVVRDNLKADVRKVLSFNMPGPLKRYILLGYPESEGDELEEKKEDSIPEESVPKKLPIVSNRVTGVISNVIQIIPK